MLTIVSTYPESNQDAVPIDIELEIEFSAEVSDAYLTSQYFRVFVLPSYTGTIACSYRREGNKVILTPLNNLPKLTQFEVFVAGDTNVADSTLQGVQSIGGEVIDSNYVFRFTTGETQEIDIITDVEIPDGTLADGTEVNAYGAKLVKSNPFDEAYAVACSGFNTVPTSGTIDLYFDDAVVLNSDLTDLIEVQTIPLDDLGSYIYPIDIHGKLYSANDLQIDYHPDYAVSGMNVIRVIIRDTDFRCNSDYNVNIQPTFALRSGAPVVSPLKDTYDLTFRTMLSPMLTTSRAVRQELRHSITNISDKIIDEYILTVSIDIIKRFYNGVASDAVLQNYWVRKYATCLVVKKLTDSVVGGHIGAVKERTLGDLTIRYDIATIREINGAVNDCIHNAEARLGTTTNSGIKSVNTTKYPGRRRDVFDV